MDLFNELDNTYTFFTDPSHGWLKVSRTELSRLGLEKLVSSYSYIDRTGNTVYLEEDCDAGLFMEKKKELGEEFKYVESHTDNESPIRNLNPYYVK